MTSLLIEDTARNNLRSWCTATLGAGTSRGAVINPFSTGPVASQSKPAAHRIASEIREAGGEVWFDAMTHILQMPAVGDFRYYGQWDLWDGARSQLMTRVLRRDHIARVFEIQRSIDATPLAPTVLANSSTGAELVAVVSLLEEAIELDSDCWASLSGTPTFWSGGPDLDALVGTLAQFEPRGWFLSVVRPDEYLPVRTTSDEIAGLCRTVRSLSEFAPVHISHGDFAGLPAIAAGAWSIGTGWDNRQRVLQPGSFVERGESTGGGGWFQRPTFERLFAFLPRVAAELMFAQDRTLAGNVFAGSLHPDGPKEAFFHHAEALSNLCFEVSAGSHEDRYRTLVMLYETAIRDWADASSSVDRPDESSSWISPLLGGLRSYGTTEGWT